MTVVYANPNEDPTPSSSPGCWKSPGDRSDGGRRGPIWFGRHADQNRRREDRVGAGCHLCHCQRRLAHPLQRIEEGRCTWFVPNSTRWHRSMDCRTLKRPVHRRRYGGARTDGGKSLLPAGVTRRWGRFDRAIRCEHHRTRRSSGERNLRVFGQRCARIIGRKSADIDSVLVCGGDEIVHRDICGIRRHERFDYEQRPRGGTHAGIGLRPGGLTGIGACSHGKKESPLRPGRALRRIERRFLAANERTCAKRPERRRPRAARSPASGRMVGRAMARGLEDIERLADPIGKRCTCRGRTPALRAR